MGESVKAKCPVCNRTRGALHGDCVCPIVPLPLVSLHDDPEWSESDRPLMLAVMAPVLILWGSGCAIGLCWIVLKIFGHN